MYQQLDISLKDGKKIYFASDIHFGEPNYEATRERERKLLRWLDSIESNAQALFLVGDIFDFWFEYKTVVPKGSVRFLGKIAAMVDSGLPVYVFTGNHDIWMNDYLEKELGVTIFRNQVIVNSSDKKIFVAHGDGLGPGDTKFKLLKKVFTNKFCQWLFRWLHPDIGIKIASLWSRRSRTGHDLEKFEGPDKEWLVAYARRKLETAHYDYFIFGHRHIPIEFNVSNASKYFNLGDWIFNNTYATFDGNNMELKYFEKK
ncbi:MAG: UDP-2,3-diacylglucosamine diphosphatase [Chitinophagales bacterium]